MHQDIETKKRIVAEYPDMTWDDFIKMEELRGRSIELIEDMDHIPCEEISSPDVFSTQPLASVHMITYNHEKYIEEAITGVVNQKCNFKFELLIGEDCSTDRTREICLEYQKKYPHIIRVLFSQNNVGASCNSRRVTLRAGGKYLAFCEGDDYWTDMNKLQMQVDVMEQHPDIGLVCTNYSMKHELTGRFEQRIVRSEDGEENLYDDVLYRDNFQRLQTAGVMVRTAPYLHALRHELIFRCLLACGDIQLFLHATQPKGLYRVIASETYVYRRAANGASFGNAQYRLILDGFLCRYVYMLKLHPAVAADDIWHKFQFLSLRYKLLQNISQNHSNEDFFLHIHKMISHIAQGNGEAKYPFAKRVLRKIPLEYYYDRSLLPYAQKICRLMEKYNIPLYDLNRSRLMRCLGHMLSPYTCVSIQYALRRVMSKLHINKWDRQA